MGYRRVRIAFYSAFRSFYGGGIGALVQATYERRIGWARLAVVGRFLTGDEGQIDR